MTTRPGTLQTLREQRPWLAHRLWLDVPVDEGSLPPAEAERRERAFVARNFAYLWLLGAIFQLLMLLVPDAHGRHDTALALLTLAGFGAFALHITGYDRLPRWFLVSSTLSGWCVIGLVVALSGDALVVAVLFYSWIGVYATYVYGARLLLLQVGVATASLSLGLVFRDGGPSAWYGPIGVAMIALICALVFALRRREQGLVVRVVGQREALARRERAQREIASFGQVAIERSDLGELEAEAAARASALLGRPCRVVAGDDPSAVALVPATGRALALDETDGALDGAQRDFLAGVANVLDHAARRQAAEEERRRLEERLASSRRVEAVGRLAGAVAHDFNNELQVILGNADLILEDASAGSQLHDDATEVRQAAERASGLVRQLLALGHQQLLRLGEVDLAALLRELAPRIRDRAGSGIVVSLDVAPALGPVRADLSSLRAVVDELVENACEAMPAGGELTLRVAAHEGSPLAGPSASLSISDTGAGMDAATCARVFEPFFTTKPLVEGAGLGLATVHGIVARSGGAIAVASEPGAGTTFTIHLPLAATHAAPGTTATATDDGMVA